MVCASVDSTAPDSLVLQVIKVLLTAVASPSFQVHGECLLTAVQTCYNIVLSRLVSKTLVSIRARGTQVLLVSRWRMDLIHVSILRSKVAHGFVNNRSMWILLCFRWCNNVIDGSWLE